MGALFAWATAALIAGAGLASLTLPPADSNPPPRGEEIVTKAAEAMTAELVIPPLPLEAEFSVPETTESDDSPVRQLDEPEVESDGPIVDATGYRFRDGDVITGRTPHRLILFTFDDGPDLRYTPRLLDILDRLGIKAVFFITASRITGPSRQDREHAEIAREIARRGHLIGNHTYDHDQLPLLTDSEVLSDLDRSEEVFGQVLGRRPWLMRPPGGARSARIDGILASRGYTQVLWNLGAGDFQLTTPEAVAATWERVLARRERELGDRGGIILLHDLHEWAVDTVPLIVGELRSRNCDLLERGEELYDVVDDLTLFFAPRRNPRRPHLEAPPADPDPAVLEARQALLREETARRCGAVAELAP